MTVAILVTGLANGCSGREAVAVELRGVVVDSEGGAPVGGIVVDVGEYRPGLVGSYVAFDSVQTDPDGTFAITVHPRRALSYGARVCGLEAVGSHVIERRDYESAPRRQVRIEIDSAACDGETRG